VRVGVLLKNIAEKRKGLDVGLDGEGMWLSIGQLGSGGVGWGRYGARKYISSGS